MQALARGQLEFLALGFGTKSCAAQAHCAEGFPVIVANEDVLGLHTDSIAQVSRRLSG